MTKTTKWILILTGLVVVAILVYIIHRVFFQFDNMVVRTNIAEQANKYSHPDQASIILNDAVQHILSSKTLTQEVLDYASLTNIPKEQALVMAALGQAKSFNYLA